ncbi:MAG: glycosyltransferase family 1 protein [Elusimicrobia bacterium]|nr:glycosyltransferase family 1 protein [Elusimicrobiota bacterium]
MTPPSPRLGRVLALCPENCARYNHVRALRPLCAELVELDFIETFKRLGIVAARDSIARVAAERRIEVFFVSFYGDSFLLPPEFLRGLRKDLGLKIVLVCYDDETTFDTHSKHYAQAVDAVVTTDYFSVAAYRALGVPAVLCLTSVSKEMYPALGLPRDIDVSFVGNCLKTDRPRYLEFLAENGIKVESFGRGSRHGFLPAAEAPKVIGRSKISLSFSRLEHTPWLHGRNPANGREMGHKGRTIEVAMTRSFCLSEWYPALPHVFEIGREIDCWTDRASLLEKIRYYLSHDEERERIAARAHERALREYEDGPYFGRVLDELEPILSASPGGREPPPLVKTREFKERQVNDLTVHALSLLLHGRPRAAARLAPELFQYGPGTFLTGAGGGLARSVSILIRKLRGV